MAKDFDNRVENIKLMHETMLCMNNEDAYDTWIWTMPDCPTEEDFAWFAEDEDEYNELYGTFFRILNRYINDGFYNPTSRVCEFMISRGYLMSELSTWDYHGEV